jgi:hypothetical protein
VNDLERMTTLRMYLESVQTRNLGVAQQLDPFTVEVRQRRTPPREPNHVLHVILSVLTCGAWLLVWLIIVLIATSSRNTYDRYPYLPGAWLVHVDEEGQIQSREIQPGIPR